MRERRNVRTATGHHVEIMAALEERDIAAACAALRSNLEHGFEPIADWLRERPAAGRR